MSSAEGQLASWEKGISHIYSYPTKRCHHDLRMGKQPELLEYEACQDNWLGPFDFAHTIL